VSADVSVETRLVLGGIAVGTEEFARITRDAAGVILDLGSPPRDSDGGILDEFNEWFGYLHTMPMIAAGRFPELAGGYEIRYFEDHALVVALKADDAPDRVPYFVTDYSWPDDPTHIHRLAARVVGKRMAECQAKIDRVAAAVHQEVSG
jgi:hypothetical protein